MIKEKKTSEAKVEDLRQWKVNCFIELDAIRARVDQMLKMKLHKNSIFVTFSCALQVLPHKFPLRRFGSMKLKVSSNIKTFFIFCF